MGLRDALLYFPYVIPFFETEHINWAEEDEVITNKLIKQFLPPDIPGEAVKDLENITKSFKAMTWLVVKQISELPSPDLQQVVSTYGEVFKRELRTFLREPLISFFVHYPLSKELPFMVGGSYAEANKIQSENDVAITIASLKLIDTNAVTLNQLIEIRKDPEAIKKLRRLRVFADENYQSKSKDFIEDDILMRLEDYERASKSLGLKTTSAAITTILDSKLIAGGIAGSFVSAYLQEPITAIIAATGTAGITIGKIAIELRRQSLEKQELMANHPVSYITYAKEKLAIK